MSKRTQLIPPGDPHFFPDGRPKASADDTSMLGLSAVWSELGEPMPARGPAASGRHAGGRRAARRQARRAAKSIPKGVVIGVGGAFVVAVLGGLILINMFIP